MESGLAVASHFNSDSCDKARLNSTRLISECRKRRHVESAAYGSFSKTPIQRVVVTLTASPTRLPTAGLARSCTCNTYIEVGFSCSNPGDSPRLDRRSTLGLAASRSVQEASWTVRVCFLTLPTAAFLHR